MSSIFANRPNKERKIAGVFEADEDVSYFYLYKMDNLPNQKIIGSVHVFSGPPDFASESVEVQWSPDESKVGVFIAGKLWAYFDVRTGTGYAGHYPDTPLEWSAAERGMH